MRLIAATNDSQALRCEASVSFPRRSIDNKVAGADRLSPSIGLESNLAVPAGKGVGKAKRR